MLGMDSNAHTTMTGSELMNARGRHFEDFILRHNPDIANRGTSPTFETHLGSTIIDITLVTPDLSEKITNWTVNEGENHSDHNTITFQVGTPNPEVQMKRNYAKLDLKAFKSRLEELSTDWKPPASWCLQEIEKAGENMQ